MRDFNDAFDSVLSPTKYIELMYDNTNERGVLYIPGWYYLNEPQYSLRCKMDWDPRDLENVIFEYKELERNIEKIARICNKASNGDFEYFKRLLDDEKLYPVWATYFQPFVYKKADQRKIDDIADKIETVKTVKDLEHKMWSDEQIEAYERSLYEEYKDLKVTKEESDIYSDYCRAFYDDCEERVGSNIGASDLILRARRLCKLIEAEVPGELINHETCMLAAALVIHRFAISMEKVNDSPRVSEQRLGFITVEDDDEYDEDDLDLLYRRKKRNSRKQMLSLFVYSILRQYSSPDKHMSQQEIIDKLVEMPYELTIERKAVGRVIHGLEDEFLGIHSIPKEGAWYDPNDDELLAMPLDE